LSAEVIDIRTILAVKSMSDWRIQNFIWYFDHYKNSDWQGDMRNKLEVECRKEAEKRGLLCDGGLKIGE